MPPPCIWNAPDAKLLAVAVLLENSAPPAIIFLTVAIPPPTANAAVVVLVASVVDDRPNVPPTFNAPPIPTPPDTTRAPVVVALLTVAIPTVTALLNDQRSSCAVCAPLLTYSILANAVSTEIPDELARVALPIPWAIMMFLSSTVITVELIIVCTPLTVKLPAMTMS